MLDGKNGRPRILVTAAGSGSALAIIRSLDAHGCRVIAADSDPSSPGLRSRHARERLIHPSPETQPAAFVEALVDAARRLAIDLIIPVFDAVVLPLSEARDRFAGLTALALPDAGSLQVARDKFKTWQLARELDIPVPRTCPVDSVEEALVAGASLGWPIVVKPHASRVYASDGAIRNLTVSYAANEAQLADCMGRIPRGCPVLLQEYYAGVGVGVEMLVRGGHPLAVFQHRRLREYPFTGGVSTFRESVALDPLLYGHAARLLSALKWTGLAMVEFKVGDHGPRLMEINGRVWGSLPLAVRSGMDFPSRLAELYLGGPWASPAAAPVTDYRVGVRVRNLKLDLSWIYHALRGAPPLPVGSRPTRREAVAALLGVLSPQSQCDVQTLEDPLPGLTELTQLVDKAVRPRRARAKAAERRRQGGPGLKGIEDHDVLNVR